MQLTVVCGPDPIAHGAARDAFFAAVSSSPDGGTPLERLDATVDDGAALVEAVGTPTLFGGTRVVEVLHAEALSVAALTRLAAAAPASDAVVLLRAERLSAAQRRALPAHEYVDARTTSPSGAARRLREYATSQAVQLDSAQLSMLVARTQDAPSRAFSVIDACARVRLSRPRTAQLDVLLGDTHATPRAYEIVDAVEAGDLAAALGALDRLDSDGAFGLCGSLRKSLVYLDARAHGASPAEAQDRTQVTDRRAAVLGRVHGDPATVCTALAATLAAEDALRASRDPGPALDVALSAYHAVFASGRPS